MRGKFYNDIFWMDIGIVDNICMFYVVCYCIVYDNSVDEIIYIGCFIFGGIYVYFYFMKFG